MADNVRQAQKELSEALRESIPSLKARDLIVKKITTLIMNVALRDAGIIATSAEHQRRG